MDEDKLGQEWTGLSDSLINAEQSVCRANRSPPRKKKPVTDRNGTESRNISSVCLPLSACYTSASSGLGFAVRRESESSWEPEQGDRWAKRSQFITARVCLQPVQTVSNKAINGSEQRQDGRTARRHSSILSGQGRMHSLDKFQPPQLSLS